MLIILASEHNPHSRRKFLSPLGKIMTAVITGGSLILITFLGHLQQIIQFFFCLLYTSLHEIDGENRLIVKGAVDCLLKRTKQICTQEGVREMTAEDKEKIQKQNQEFSMEGLRVLAFTLSLIHI